MRNIKNAVGRGTSFVTYWRCRQDYGADTFKISLTVYDKDVLQVRDDMGGGGVKDVVLGTRTQVLPLDARLLPCHGKVGGATQ
jgi:hypothetical protein